MCICENDWIGMRIELKTKQEPFFPGIDMFSHLSFRRTDKWHAVIESSTAQSGRKEPFVKTEIEINYCPMCGRRLSLRDAGREK